MIKKNPVSKPVLSLSVQYTDTELEKLLPRSKLRRWIQAALTQPAYLTLRFVNAAESRELNARYRGKDYATNVLTFCYDTTPPAADLPPPREADIVVCMDVLKQEAAEQQKPLLAHAAHLIVHGVLHAQGYDHEQETDARVMEARETVLVKGFGFADPWETEKS